MNIQTNQHVNINMRINMNDKYMDLKIKKTNSNINWIIIMNTCIEKCV